MRRRWQVTHVAQPSSDVGVLTVPCLQFWTRGAALRFAQQMNDAAVYGGQTTRWFRFGYYVERTTT